MRRPDLLLRPWLRELRGRLQRRLHPGRRRAAFRRLASLPRPRSVLFICQGNIYRSPFAATLFSTYLPRDQRSIRSLSAGFLGPDRPCPEDAVHLAATQYGVDLAPHRSRLLDSALARTVDLLVVMDPAQRAVLRRHFVRRAPFVLVLGDLDPEPIDARAIPDPWKGEAAVLEGSYARVERCTRQLVEIVAGRRPGALPRWGLRGGSRHPTAAATPSR